MRRPLRRRTARHLRSPGHPWTRRRHEAEDFILAPDGRTKREIIRCPKRFLAREIYQRVMTDFRIRHSIEAA